jgi:LysM repeat protein
MQNVRLLLFFILLFTGIISRSQDAAIIQSYINTYKDIAISEMERTGVPASIKLAQGIHETMAGTSVLVIKSNNHFGIKCKAAWTGKSVSHDDDARGECFRKYDAPADSYRDHSDFLKGSARYASLFRLDPLDYAGWAYGLKKAGYATNPKYAQIIIKLIQDYQLQDYTLIALGKSPVNGEILAKASVEKNEKEFIPAVAIVKAEETERTAMPEPESIAKRPQYPHGEFKINETKVIYAKKGTPFLILAQQYNIPLARIFEFNDMSESETLTKDQLIYLQRKRKTGNNEFHIVKPGETLHDIAQKEAIRIESLLEYNQLQKSIQPAIGQRLCLQAKASGRPGLAKNETTQDQITVAKNETGMMSAKGPQMQQMGGEAIDYTVQPKETIYSISKKYNIKIDDLVQWNQLSSYDLKTGQVLKIYK